MARPRILVAVAVSVLLLPPLFGCGAVGRTLENAARERPPTPLDSMSVASDARIDSAGVLAGSFVGEGTSRAVHLLSSDTAFIVELARRYRPDLLGEGPLWTTLAERRTVDLREEPRRRTATRGKPLIGRALVGSPLGHTAVTLEAVILRGAPGAGRCGSRGAQAELVVREDFQTGDPPLRGPVLGAFLAGASADRGGGLVARPEVAAPSDRLTRHLIARTRLVMDSAVAARFPSLQARPLHAARLEINTLSDLDAADVTAFRSSAETIRYAVSLRERRVRAGGLDTLVATAVMVWDSAGAWRQTVFRPTVLAAIGGRVDSYPPIGDTYYWRRLQPISDLAYQRDNLWMEQVDVRSGTVLWGIVEPRGNVVVAAAEVEGVCR